jgi:hypothetical protein
MLYHHHSLMLNHAFHYVLGWLQRRAGGFKPRAWGSTIHEAQDYLVPFLSKAKHLSIPP